MTGLLILLASLVGAPAGTGCADHWVVSLDDESFANNGAGKSFAAEELTAFNAGIAAAIKRAVGEACDDGSIEPGAVELVRDVVVHSASGATEPHIYAAGDRALHLEWIFAEEDLAIPPDVEIVAAATCWTKPDEATCAEQGD